MTSQIDTPKHYSTMTDMAPNLITIPLMNIILNPFMANMMLFFNPLIESNMNMMNPSSPYMTGFDKLPLL